MLRIHWLIFFILPIHSWALPAVKRLVAIGDVHGDYQVTRRAVQLAQVMNEQDQWIGGNTVLVQVGDQLDRGDGEKKIVDLLEQLKPQAQKAGGDVIVLNGNHEVMNVDLDFRYVTVKGASEFQHYYQSGQAEDAILKQVPKHLKGRAVAMRPGGPYARIFGGHQTVLVMGKTLFVHGGVTAKYARYGLDKINQEISNWFLSKGARPEFISDDQSPIWSRHYSSDGADLKCDELEKTLKLLNLDRMVVAHTVQTQGINSACAGKVWRIDTGLSSYYGGKLEVLEISDDSSFKVLGRPTPPSP